MKLKKYRLVLENSISLFSLKAIDLGLTLWLIPFLIVKVGLEQYGVYAFAMSLVLFFLNLLNYGFNLSTVREIARAEGDKVKLQVVFNEVFSVKLFLFVFLYSLFIALTFAVPVFYEHKVLYLMSSLLIVGDLFSLRWFFMGLEKMKFITFIQMLGTLIFVLLVVFFVENKSNIVWVPLFEALGMFITSIIAFTWVLKSYHLEIKLISLREIFSYLKINFSSFINLLLPSTYNTTIVFLVGVFGLPAQVGFIEIGVKFTAAFSTINTILTNVFFPLINRKKTALLSIQLLLNSLGVVLSLAMYFLADYLIWNWLKFEHNSDLVQTVEMVRVLSFLPFLTAMISSYGINGLLTMDKDKLFGNITIFSTFWMVIAAVILIPKYPQNGGAFAFLSGRLVYALLSFYFYKQNKIYE